MFREIFESSEETYNRKVMQQLKLSCEAKRAIFEYNCREGTEKDIEDYLYTD